MNPNSDPEYRITMRTLLGEGGQFWQDDIEFIRLYNIIHPYSFVSPYRCYFIYQFAKNANALNGQFAELGVYKGGTAKLISSVKSKDKNLFLFDTFNGLPQHNPLVDDLPKGKFAETTVENIKSLFEGDDSVKIFAGVFPETTQEIRNEKFSFVYLDADLYKSTYDGLNFFYSRMVTGGIILFDDYDWVYCKGVKESINDFRKENNIPEIPIITTKYQCVIIKS